MHTEISASRVEQYITAHRTRLALWMGAALTVALYLAWVFVSAAMHVSSPTLDACVFALSLAGSAIATLAFYWSAE